MRSRHRGWIALVAALTLGLAACGSSGSTETTTAGEDPGETNEAAPADGDLETFCETVVEAEATVLQGPDIDFEAASEEDIGEALVAFAAEVTPLLDLVTESAPGDAPAELGEVVSMVGAALETGDEDFFFDPDFRAADRAVDEYVMANCGYEQVSVTAVDYAFQGLPETLSAGRVAFDFSNQGEEMHEMAVMRVREGVTETLVELLELPDEETFEKVDFVAFALAAPGGGDIAFLDLEPGRHVFICFIPVGTTPEMMEELMEEMDEDGEGDLGTPHFAEGMVTEVAVEG